MNGHRSVLGQCNFQMGMSQSIFRIRNPALDQWKLSVSKMRAALENNVTADWCLRIRETIKHLTSLVKSVRQLFALWRALTITVIVKEGTKKLFQQPLDTCGMAQISENTTNVNILSMMAHKTTENQVGIFTISS